MYKEVTKWLRLQSMPVGENHLRLRLESHPDYPSLIAVQDTLEELGINAYACHGTKEELKKENKPFLAHFNIGEGYILSFKDVASAEQKVKDFNKQWSGNVMFMDKPTSYGNADHDKLFRSEKQNRIYAIVAALLFLTAMIGLPFYTGSVSTGLLAIANIAGLYLSWLIAQKEFGVSNSISDKICSMAKHSRCEAVLHSKGSKLFNWLSWGDVGMVYFSASLLYLLFSQLTNTPISLYYYLSLTGLVFPLYSLYYQWRVVKQWCMLCVGVLLVLLINAAIAATQIKSIVAQDIWRPALTFAAISVLLLAVWQLVKHTYRQSLTALTNSIKAERLKRNPQIFNALLDKQELKQENFPEVEEPLRFGNPNAPYQLVIACNPYCGPCRRAHKTIEELYEKYPDNIGVTIRFAITNTSSDDIMAITVKEIIQAALVKPYNAIKDWFHVMDIDKFRQIHKGDKHQKNDNSKEAEDHAKKHAIWNKKINITGTPTFFINGKRLPEIFSWVDFIEILRFEMKKTD